MGVDRYDIGPTSGESSILKRREFIERAGLAVGALGIPMLLEACAPAATPSAPASSATAARPAAAGTSTGATAGTAAKSGSLVPTYVPWANGPKPDYPSQGDPY